jgi:hypothetical protein
MMEHKIVTQHTNVQTVSKTGGLFIQGRLATENTESTEQEKPGQLASHQLPSFLCALCVLCG